MNRTTDAERVLVDALAGRSRVLGPHHPSTAATRLELAVLYADQGKIEAARPLALEAYADLADGGVSGTRLETAKRLIDRLANGGPK